jgi:putative heme-binding domain-containing protein
MSPIQLAAWSDLRGGEVLDGRPRWGSFAIDGARIVAPGDPCGSVLYYRVATAGGGRMPRLGSRRVDVRGTRLLYDWIASLPAAAAPASLPPGETLAARPVTTRAALAFLAQVDAGGCGEEALTRARALARDAPSPEVRDLLERLLPESERRERLGTMIEPAAILALAGDAARGAAVFGQSAAAQCSSCHRVRGEGKAVGPDLDGVGKKYSAQQLLQHLLEPSREVAPQNAAHALVTRQGEVLTGLVSSRDESEVVLKDAKGELHRVASSDVQSLEKQAESLMPAGLLRDLTAQEAADLVAFLAALRRRFAAPGSMGVGASTSP